MNLHADTTSKKEDRSIANSLSRPRKGTGGKSMVQRIVALGLPKGTKVVIQRTTSKEFHGATATIEKEGADKNEYIVRVDETDTILSVRADQLFMESEKHKLRDPNIEADFSTVRGLSQEQIVDHVINYAKQAFKLEDQPRVGGSFAAMLHAFASGTDARTPRDIDVLISKNDYRRSGGDTQGRPLLTGERLWGVPIELHLIDIFFKKDKITEGDKIIPKNLLLKKAVVKLIKQNYLFKAELAKEKEPQGILAAMEKANDDLMRHEDVSEESRKIWMKTMVDIRALIDAGAQLPEEEL
jgi:hypothetical protein